MTLLASGTASDLLRVVWTSLLASIVVSVLFSGGVVGLIRAGELRRGNRDKASSACAIAATIALGVCVAAVVYGVILVSQKS